MNTSPTPIEDINALVVAWANGLRKQLGSRLIGAYVTGSLGYGGFKPERSDVDLCAITTAQLTTTDLKSIEALHRQVEAMYPKWLNRVECSYIPIHLFGHITPPAEPRPWWGFGTMYAQAPYGDEWIMNAYDLQSSITITGEDFATLIEPPVGMDEVREASARSLFREWAPIREAPEWLDDPHHQSYLILTLCRIYQTLVIHKKLSKPKASAMCMEHFPEYAQSIHDAELWQPGQPMAHKAEALGFLDRLVRFAYRLGYSPTTGLNTTKTRGYRKDIKARFGEIRSLLNEKAPSMETWTMLVSLYDGCLTSDCQMLVDQSIEYCREHIKMWPTQTQNALEVPKTWLAQWASGRDAHKTLLELIPAGTRRTYYKITYTDFRTSKQGESYTVDCVEFHNNKEGIRRGRAWHVAQQYAQNKRPGARDHLFPPNGVMLKIETVILNEVSTTYQNRLDGQHDSPTRKTHADLERLYDMLLPLPNVGILTTEEPPPNIEFGVRLWAHYVQPHTYGRIKEALVSIYASYEIQQCLQCTVANEWFYPNDILAYKNVVMGHGYPTALLERLYVLASDFEVLDVPEIRGLKIPETDFGGVWLKAVDHLCQNKDWRIDIEDEAFLSKLSQQLKAKQAPLWIPKAYQKIPNDLGDWTYDDWTRAIWCWAPYLESVILRHQDSQAHWEWKGQVHVRYENQQLWLEGIRIGAFCNGPGYGWSWYLVDVLTHFIQTNLLQ